MMDRYDLMCQLQEDSSKPYKETIEQLRQRVAELEDYHEAYRQECHETYGEQLAASQLREKKLRESVERVVNRPIGIASSVRDELEAALSQPTDDSALQEYVMDQFEDVGYKCLGNDRIAWKRQIAEGETLYSLKETK